MLIADYIRKVKNWEQAFEQYGIKVKYNRSKSLAIFNYTMGADFFNPLVREARGCIVDMISLMPVCRGFDKFMNYGEPECDNIDWSSARIQEKVDGSIMKLYWWAGEWCLASNGMIEAEEPFKSLFWKAAKEQGLDLSELELNYTYIFELVSPETQVVVSYPKAKIYHLGTRNNYSGEEEYDVDIGIQKPKSYPLTSLDECIKAAEMLNAGMDYPENEGFVVVDDNYNRVKIKSPLYVEVHHDVSRGLPSIAATLDLIRTGEASEVLCYHDNLREYFEKMEGYHNRLKDMAVLEIETASAEFAKHGGFGRLTEWMDDNGYIFKDLVYKWIRGEYNFDKLWAGVRLKKYVKLVEKWMEEDNEKVH